MEYNINLTDKELNLIGAALGELKYREVVDLMTKLKEQAAQQEAVPPVPPPEA